MVIFPSVSVRVTSSQLRLAGQQAPPCIEEQAVCAGIRAIDVRFAIASSRQMWALPQVRCWRTVTHTALRLGSTSMLDAHQVAIAVENTTWPVAALIFVRFF